MAVVVSTKTPDRVLVTGASGFVGAQLVPMLLQQNHQVRVVTRDPEQLQRHDWHSQVEVIVGDLFDADVCARAVAGIDAIVHLAGLAHVRASSHEHRQQNFLITKQLAQAAQAANVQTFVYISSCKARYPAHSDYGHYKLASENFLLALQGAMRVVCLRPGVIYGVGMRNNLRTLLRLLQRPSLPVFVGSNNGVSMISVGDCCRAIIAAIQQPQLAGKVWELSDGQGYTLNTLVSRVRQSLQRPLPVLVLGRWTSLPLFVLASIVPPLRWRGVGLNSWRVLFSEHYPAEKHFAEASGVWPQDTLYQIMPALIEQGRTTGEST